MLYRCSTCKRYYGEGKINIDPSSYTDEELLALRLSGRLEDGSCMVCQYKEAVSKIGMTADVFADRMGNVASKMKVSAEHLSKAFIPLHSYAKGFKLDEDEKRDDEED